MPFPAPGDLLHPGVEPTSSVSPVLAGGFFTTELPGKPLITSAMTLFSNMVTSPSIRVRNSASLSVFLRGGCVTIRSIVKRLRLEPGNRGWKWGSWSLLSAANSGDQRALLSEH